MPYQVRTPAFEGDLELLTQLVSRSELDVFEVCLRAIIDGYIAEVTAEGAKPDLNVTTEFLLLMSYLVELKSRYLLLEDDDPGEDVELPLPEDRDLMLAHLLQGRTFKEAAQSLAAMIRRADLSFPRTMGPEEPLRSAFIDPLETVDALDLRAALLRALAPRPVVDLYHVTPIRASVSDAIDRVVQALTRYEQLSLFDLNEDQPDRLERIVRFLAVLELYKQGIVDIEQAESFGDLLVRARLYEEDEELALAAFNQAADDDDDVTIDDRDDYGDGDTAGRAGHQAQGGRRA